MSSLRHFQKLQGCGNDFIFFEDLEDRFNLSPEQVIALCDRHFGIGADGVIIFKPASEPGCVGFMDYINSDGTLAQMCGNGVRCFSKYAVDNGIAPKDAPSIKVQTRAGVKEVTFTLDDTGSMSTATVDMGAPILEPASVPTTLAATEETAFGIPFVANAPVDSPFGTFEFTCVSMGNPHAVTFVDDCMAVDIDRVGAYFESCDAFPEKANIEFATLTDDGIRMRVFERGCGETLACGTGACATGVAAYLTGRAGTDNPILLLGGCLNISYEPGGTVHMTGPACKSFEGEILC